MAMTDMTIEPNRLVVSSRRSVLQDRESVWPAAELVAVPGAGPDAVVRKVDGVPVLDGKGIALRRELGDSRAEASCK